MKKFLSMILLLFVFIGAFAQGGDTIPYTPAATSPDGIAGIAATITQAFPNVLSIVKTWLPVVLLILGVTQFILKRIPTPESVKIGGRVGWIADLLTFYQRDILSKCVLLLIGLTLTGGLSSCTVTKQQAILKGACELHEFSTYTRPAPGADTLSILPAAVQGTDSVGVYLVCNNEMILANYPNVGTDIVKSKSFLATLVKQALQKIGLSGIFKL